MTQHHFMVDPTDIPILIEVLEGLDLDSMDPERSLDVNRILLGAQIAKRNNERNGEVDAIQQEVDTFVDQLDGLTTAEIEAELGPVVPPPEANPAQEGG